VNEADAARITDRAVEQARADGRVVGVLVYGSRATGTADGYSDLDLGIVVGDADVEAFVADAPSFVDGLGEALFLEHFGNPARLHAILADGGDVELIIDRLAEADLGLPHRVVFARDGALPPSGDRPPPGQRDLGEADGAADLRRRITWFWHDVGHLVTALGRGNTWWAYGQLDELRRMVINLARIEAGQEPDDEAYWKLDETLPPSRLDALHATVAPPEPVPMLEAAVAVLELYRDVARPLAVRHAVAYPNRLDRLLTARLEALRSTGERGSR
jgi:predicted nucleotidyltransferase